MSEPYSEVADTESARRLLEFGDDYRNFLDSQSDCASSLSAVHYVSNTFYINKHKHRKISILLKFIFIDNIFYVQQRSNVTSEDSDSDSEFKRLTETSRNQLLISESRYGAIADTSFVRTGDNALALFYNIVRNMRNFLAAIATLVINIAKNCFEKACDIGRNIYNSFLNLFLLRTKSK